MSTAFAGTSGPAALTKHPMPDAVKPRIDGISLQLDAPAHTEATAIRTRLEMATPSSDIASTTKPTSPFRTSAAIKPAVEPWAPGKGAFGIRVQITW